MSLVKFFYDFIGSVNINDYTGCSNIILNLYNSIFTCDAISLKRHLGCAYAHWVFVSATLNQWVLKNNLS